MTTKKPKLSKLPKAPDLVNTEENRANIAKTLNKLTGHDLLLSKEVKVERVDKPASFYLSPKKVGTKVVSTDDKKLSEDQVVKQCTKYFHEQGWLTKTLFTGGIPLGGGKFATNPAKGIPDCLVFNTKERRMVWVEYKKSHGGILSTEQQGWRNLLIHCGCEVWVINSLKVLKEHLHGTVTTTN